MPGYLTNRYISLDVSNTFEEIDTNITSLESRIIEAEGNIEDLQLNIGV